MSGNVSIIVLNKSCLINSRRRRCLKVMIPSSIWYDLNARSTVSCEIGSVLNIALIQS